MSVATQHRTEVRSRQDEDELAKLSGEVESLRQELRRAQRLATVGTMTAMVAHEFNNILTPIVNYAQLAQKNPKMTEKAVNRACQGGLRATKICDAILSLSDAKPQKPTRENMVELVTQSLSVMARDLSRDRIELVLDIPDDFQIVTRRIELQQVLLNLILNARTSVMATRGLRRIEIQAVRCDGAVVITVSDNGIGIEPENMDRIFQPFFTTADDTAGETRGHGLGLAFCREIINAMNGGITASSTPGQGATFTIRLPDELVKT